MYLSKSWILLWILFRGWSLLTNKGRPFLSNFLRQPPPLFTCGRVDDLEAELRVFSTCHSLLRVARCCARRYLQKNRNVGEVDTRGVRSEWTNSYFSNSVIIYFIINRIREGEVRLKLNRPFVETGILQTGNFRNDLQNCHYVVKISIPSFQHSLYPFRVERNEKGKKKKKSSRINPIERSTLSRQLLFFNSFGRGLLERRTF